MTYFYINGAPSTMREAMNRWMIHGESLGHDSEWDEEVFALALYHGEAEGANILPEEAREHLLDAGIEVIN